MKLFKLVGMREVFLGLSNVRGAQVEAGGVWAVGSYVPSGEGSKTKGANANDLVVLGVAAREDGRVTTRSEEIWSGGVDNVGTLLANMNGSDTQLA